MTHLVGRRQKLLMLLIVFIFLVSCSFTKKIYYTEDKFYPQNSRYHTDWLGGGSSVNIRFIKRSNDKIYIQTRYELRRSFYVEDTDTIALKFADGTVLSLKYDGYISKPLYRDFSVLYLDTKLKEITEFGMLKYIRADTSLGYENFEITNLDYAEELINFFNRLKNNEYDELVE